ncbi:MAG TPA: restriction endonuclease, partial [Leucothrix mucor]|nr:restriction endonuclease [Leucothrix mucor]
MSNILKAIINIANNPIAQLKDTYSGRNSINNIG